MKKYSFDGNSFTTVDGFFKMFGEMVNGVGGYFGKDLQSFDDCLFGGYGLPNECEIVWKNSNQSKVVLSHKAYADWCHQQIEKKNYLDDEGLSYLESEESKAVNKELGKTLFDAIVDQIQTVNKRSLGKSNINLILD